MKNLNNTNVLPPSLKEIKQEKARRKFWQFCLYYDQDFFTRRPFLQEVAEAFQWLFDEYVNGRPRKVSVSMPPRAGKSYITSLFCAWWLGKLNEQSVMRNTCTARLYEKFSYDVRNIVKADRWKEVFALEMAVDKQNLYGWNLTTAKQVSYFGAGVGGTIIGFGANLAITDDLFADIEQALSENYNEKVVTWKESAHDSRKEKNCPEIFIGTRWSKRDVIGAAIEKGEIDRSVTIKAMNDDGTSFCEDVKTTTEYTKIKESIDETIWEAEYQQSPIETKGLLFPHSELKKYTPSQFDVSKSGFCFIPVDPADKGGDFYGAPVCHLVGDKIFVTWAIFNKFDTDENIPATVEMACENKAHFVQVEGNGGWVLSGKNIREKIEPRLPDCEVRIIKATTNKETRILANSAFLKRVFYFREDYADHKEYAAMMKNLTGYLREGGNKNDDAPDVLTQAADYFQRNFSHLW